MPATPLARRAGKKSNPVMAHDRFKFIRIFFVLGIVGLLVLLTGIVIMLGPLNISVADSYSALLARFWPRGLEHPVPPHPVWGYGRIRPFLKDPLAARL